MPMLMKKLVGHHLESDDREADEDDTHALDGQPDQFGIAFVKADTASRGTSSPIRNPAIVTHVAPMIVSFSTRSTRSYQAKEIIPRDGHALIDAHDDHHEEERRFTMPAPIIRSPPYCFSPLLIGRSR